MSSQLSQFQRAMAVGRSLEGTTDRKFKVKDHLEVSLKLRIDSNDH